MAREDGDGTERAAAGTGGPRGGGEGDPGRGARRGEWWGPGFELVRRGYDPAQVEEAMDRAEAELQVMTADRDAMVHAEADARAEVRGLRAELDRVVRTPISLDGVSARMQHLLALAQEEADRVGAGANTEAHTLVEQARERARRDVSDAAERARTIVAEASGRAAKIVDEAGDQARTLVLEAEHQAGRLRREAEEGAAAAERRRQQSEEEQRELVERTAAETERADQDAAAERARLDEEALARRGQVEQDFETAMRARRAEVDAGLAETEARRRGAEERRRAVEADAAERLAAAQGDLDDLEGRRRLVRGQLMAMRAGLADLAELTVAPDVVPVQATGPTSGHGAA